VENFCPLHPPLWNYSIVFALHSFLHTQTTFQFVNINRYQDSQQPTAYSCIPHDISLLQRGLLPWKPLLLPAHALTSVATQLMKHLCTGATRHVKRARTEASACHWLHWMEVTADWLAPSDVRALIGEGSSLCPYMPILNK
jgi:hypothetical protein